MTERIRELVMELKEIRDRVDPAFDWHLWGDIAEIIDELAILQAIDSAEPRYVYGIERLKNSFVVFRQRRTGYREYQSHHYGGWANIDWAIIRPKADAQAEADRLNEVQS